MDEHAPNLTSDERKDVIAFLNLPREHRARVLKDCMTNPKISGSLRHVLRYLLTA